MTPDPLEHDDGVLAPDELQLEDDHVEELGENRYLVRSDGSGSKRTEMSGPSRPQTHRQRTRRPLRVSTASQAITHARITHSPTRPNHTGSISR